MSHLRNAVALAAAGLLLAAPAAAQRHEGFSRADTLRG
jgi:hypothetical protein